MKDSSQSGFAMLLLPVVIGIAVVIGYFYYQDYNSVEKVCQKKFDEVGEFIHTNSKLQEMVLAQSKEESIENCIMRGGEYFLSERSDEDGGVVRTEGRGIDLFSTGDPEKDKTLRLFQNEHKERETDNVRLKRIAEICDDDTLSGSDQEVSLDIPYANTGETFENEYISPYGFSITYPDGWDISTDEVEDIHTMYLNKVGNEEQEIVIGTWIVFSTSGALCANQWCDYDGHNYQIDLNGEVTDMEVVGRSLFRRDYDEELTTCDMSLDFIGFRAGATFGEYDLPHFSEPTSLVISVSFADEEEGKEIQEILNTLEY